MKKSTLLWILAFVVTIASAYYQRVTGPTYPQNGTVTFENQLIKYKLDRSHSGYTDQEVKLAVADKAINGFVLWKRFKTDDAWTRLAMARRNDSLFAFLPAQPSAGKLMYSVNLQKGDKEKSITAAPVVIRFKGDVPLWILIPHVLFMFSAMLFSTRTGIEVFVDKVKAKKYMLFTFLFLLAGGFVCGPIVQKFAFGEYWTGVPFGFDLTDNKTLIALIGWIIAAVMVFRQKREKFWISFAALLMLVVFLIPHSVLGSELDYNKMDKEKALHQNIE